MSILVATDLSTRSIAAIRFAEVLAEKLDTPLTILHVAPNTRKDIVADARNALELFLRDSSEHPERHTTDVIIGEIGDVISRFGSNHELVVCGATGSSYLEDIFLGTTASRLIRESPSPVCVVPDRHTPRFERMIVAMGFDDASRAALSLGERLAERTGAALHLLSAVAAGDEAATRQKLEVMAAERDGVEIGIHVRTGNSAEVIRSAVVDLDADVVVMGTHGRDEQALYFLGSVAERVVRQPPCAVVTVRPFDG